MRFVVWTGSRGWTDVGLIIDGIVSLRKPFFSIVGDADGFDTLVWECLAEYRFPRVRFKALWERYGRAAGPNRNGVMLDYLQAHDPRGFVIAGWDGTSRGTKNCINQAEHRGIDVWRLGGYIGSSDGVQVQGRRKNARQLHRNR